MSAWGASAAQDMMRWKGGLPGTMMLTMNVNGALLALRVHPASVLSQG